MSAEERWHEDAPKDKDEPIISQASPSWMRALGSEEISALSQGQVSGVDEHPEPAPDGAAEDLETLATLLRAIQSTEIAVRLGDLASPGNLQIPAPAPASSAKPAAVTSTFKPEPANAPLPARWRTAPASSRSSKSSVQTPRRAASSRRRESAAPTNTAHSLPVSAAGAARPAAPFAYQPPSPRVRRIAPAVNRASAYLVQAQPFSASTRLMPASAALSRRPAPAAHPNTSIPLAMSVAPQPPSPIPMPAASATASAILLPGVLPSFSETPPPLPVLARLRSEIDRLAALIVPALQNMRQAGVRLSTALRNWTATEAAPVVVRLSRATARSSVRLVSWALTHAALLIHRTSLAALQLSTRLWSWVKAEVPPAMERIARVSKQASAGFGHWAANSATLTTQSMNRAATQVSTGLRNRAASSAALATQRKSRAGTQVSTGLSNRADTKPAEIAANMGRARAQVSSGIKDWLGPRRGSRVAEPPLIAWCWTADTPRSLNIANISCGGLYLLTDVRWPLGGRVSMTLQRTDRSKDAPESWIVTDFVVLRWCKDGLAGALIPPSQYSVARDAENRADPRTLKRFVKQLAVPARR